MVRRGPMDAELRELRRFIDEDLVPTKVPILGVVALKDGEHIFSHFAGDARPGRALDGSSIIRVYSMTKVVTAVAILQLRDAGKFALDDRVSSLLDEWHDGAARPATVFDLLTHSAGLSYGFKNGDVAKQYRERGLELPHRITPHGDRDNSRFPTSSSLKEFCATLSRLPRALEPGREFSYSASFDVLGRIVEATSGTDLESYFREHIFEPLGMRDTSFVLSNDKQDRLAACALLSADGSCEDAADLLPHAGALDERNFWRGGTASYAGPNVCPSGGGGLLSTIDDWLRFANGLRTDKLLDPSTLQELCANQLEPHNIAQLCLSQYFPAFGLGVWTNDVDGRPPHLGQSWLPPDAGKRTFGWPGAAGTSFLVDLERGLVLIIATQMLQAAHVMQNIYATIHCRIYAALSAS